MINSVVTTPLDPAIHGLTLSAISKEDRLSELEFYFPPEQAYAGNLRNIFKEERHTVFRGISRKNRTAQRSSR